jgi:hypothetical protein
MKHIFRRPLLYVVMITLLGAFLRIYHLGFKTLWYDELVIYANSLGSISEIVQKNAIGNSAPPTFTFLVHFISYLGHSEFWLRLPSCIAGILAIPAGYFAFKRYAGKMGAIFGCLLLAVAHTQVRYSQEVREYSFVVLFTILLFYFTTRAIYEKEMKQFFLFGITAAISILFQYGLALVVAVLSGIIFGYLVKDARRKIWWFVLSYIPVVLSVVLVYFISLRYQYQPRGFASSSYLSGSYFGWDIASLPAFFIYNTEAIFRYAFDGKCEALLLLLCVLGCFHCIKQKQYLALLMLYGPFGVIFIAGVLSLYPYDGTRQVIFLSVPLYLICSTGMHYLEKNNYHLVIGVLSGIFIIYGGMDSLCHAQKESPENTKSIVKILKDQFRSGDQIFASPGSAPAFRYYLNWLSGHVVHQPDCYSKQGKTALTEPVDPVEPIITCPGRVWLVFTHYVKEDADSFVDIIQKKRDVRLVSAPDDYAKLYLVTDEDSAK